MNIVTKDSYKFDIYSFDLERRESIVDMTINNVISWEWIKMKLTKEEIKGLAQFLNQFVENNN
jgi:hypothetical protein